MLVVCVQVVVSLMAINSDQACAFSAAHLFKLRHLLAMGKVVVSEVSRILEAYRLFVIDVTDFLS